MMAKIATRVPLWHRRFWAEESPSRKGWLVCLAFPALFWIPFESIPLFPTWAAGAGTLAWVGMYVLTCALARQSGVPRPSFIWLFQKGLSVPDYAITCWLWSVVAGIGVLSWWAVGLGIAALFHSISFAAAGWYWLWLGASFVLGSAGLFMLGALRVRSTVELWTGVTFLALLAPLAAMTGPAWLAKVLAAVLPPFAQLATLKQVAGEITVGQTAAILAHTAAFAAMALVVGIWRLRRWRPGAAS